MAAVTVNSQHDRPNVIGHLLEKYYTDVDIAADGDTLDTRMSEIVAVQSSSSTNNAIGHTVSGGVITFQIGGGAENTVFVRATGRR